MKLRVRVGLMALALAVLGPVVSAEEVDSGVIRLGGAKQSAAEPGGPADAPPPASLGTARRGFDYESFEARLEALWFQRKAFLADGRDKDAARQAELMRSFCLEEGVKRVESMAAALLTEADRFIDEGHYAKALASIELAEAFDPGRPQIGIARAKVSWRSRSGYFRAAGEYVEGGRRSVLRSLANLTALNGVPLVVVIGVLGTLAIFAVAMLIRYNVPLRHEVEEWLVQRDLGHWSAGVGWGLILLPFAIWIAAGWAALYWIALFFRFMRRSERLTAAMLLLAVAFAVPAYRVGVAVYGVTTDPVVRTTLASARGGYDPDRIVELRQLVDAYPEDPIYKFLLAGLYKNGRYFEEAYDQYQQVLALRPAMHQALINSGNILAETGQHSEAVKSYRRAIELHPGSVLAYYNMHLVQQESFHFKEAEESLDLARRLDAKRTSEIMEESRAGNEHARTIDASVQVGSVWQAALEGRKLREAANMETAGVALPALLGQLVNPLSIAALLTLVLAGVMAAAARHTTPARRCIRCGRPFCLSCRSGRQGQEYCTQCLHLFVIGDGLAPETKTRKLFEVERYERWTRSARRLVSLVLPGSGHLARGRAMLGCGLLLAWLAALVTWRPEILAPLRHVLGVDPSIDAIREAPVPAVFGVHPGALFALLAAIAVWTIGNVWHWRSKGV